VRYCTTGAPAAIIRFEPLFREQKAAIQEGPSFWPTRKWSDACFLGAPAAFGSKTHAAKHVELDALDEANAPIYWVLDQLRART
jgi:hypothetical protein